MFVGYDEKESVAYHVLSHSILRRASVPVSIAPLNRVGLAGIFTRPRGQYDSTDFSMSRFLVPYLCGYEGVSIFMDCDMLCRENIAELLEEAIGALEGNDCAVVKHDYQPKQARKFLGQEQTRYYRKNWSSMIVFDCERCSHLTPDVVNDSPGLWLHQFQWAQNIGSIDPSWNYLVGEDGQSPKPKLIHFTNGIPCFSEYRDSEYAEEWFKELALVNAHA